MQNYLLRTQHNETLSDALATGASSLNIDLETVQEAFSEDCWQKELGVQCIPCLVAITEINGNQTIIHQTDSVYALASFQATADAKLAELEA